MTTTTSLPPRLATPEEWLTARLALLREEKELTRRRDQLSQRRRELPWVRLEKPYVFQSEDGPVSLAGLFGGRSQLIVYHFMFGPGWEEGCKSCSFVADHFDGVLPHLAARDVSFAAVSRAPLGEFLPFKQRLGWKFNWVSSHGSDFNFDFHVSFSAEEMARGPVPYNYGRIEAPYEELPGFSVFARDGESVFHTYSTYSRGFEPLMNTYNFLDLVPKGRDEGAFAFPMEWVRYHDRYEPAAARA